MNPINPINPSKRVSPRAIIPVHLYGQPADMDSIQEIADRYGLLVVEDACQAHGAEYYIRRHQRWQRAGSMGVAGCFSFYPGKNLGACGEGGAVTTNDESIARKIRMLRDHGQVKKYYHDFEGYNGRLDAIQAGILRVKLGHLADWNEKRRRIAHLYNELLSPTSQRATHSPGPAVPDSQLLNGIIPPHEPSWAKGVYHLYVIRTPKRDELQKYLAANGIGTGLHYPIPLHLQKAYAGNGYSPGMFPVTERVSSEILSLPMFPTLEEDQVLYVVEKIKEFCADAGSSEKVNPKGAA